MSMPSCSALRCREAPDIRRWMYLTGGDEHLPDARTSPGRHGHLHRPRTTSGCFADRALPPAAQAVLERLRGRTYMTGAEATDLVPLTTDFRKRLAADRTTPAASSVHTIASDPLLVFSEAENGGGAFWWDPLNAVAATVRGIVRYAPRRIGIVQRGENEGRTFLDPRGPLVHHATGADGEAFHTTSSTCSTGACPPAQADARLRCPRRSCKAAPQSGGGEPGAHPKITRLGGRKARRRPSP